MNWITLTTDFGVTDWFVGTMKGVIAGIAPEAAIVDLTHAVPGGEVRAGAFALAAGCRFFPRGTVHVAVVDPGVGSDRAALAVQTEDYFFVGPDNGVLSWALAGEKILGIRQLANEDFFRHPVSRTFHGRDLFAPVAAHLCRGVPFERLGPAVADYQRLPWPEPRESPEGWEGEIIYIDRFGNAITNLEASWLEVLVETGANVKVRRERIAPIRTHYQAVPPGEAVAVAGSSGFLEIAVNGGSAAARFNLKIGEPVRVNA